MPAMTAVDVAERFVDRINAKDIDGLAALMTDGHRLIDSLGVEVVGRERVRRGWEDYFRMVPDYRVEVRKHVADGELVVLLGMARGTYSRDGALHPGQAWETPERGGHLSGAGALQSGRSTPTMNQSGA